MACLNCCQNPICLENVCAAGFTLDTNFLAPEAGAYRLEALFLSRLVSFSLNADLGQRLVFSLFGLNESFSYDFKLFGPSGQILLGVSGIDCIRVKTIPYGGFSQLSIN